MSRIEMIRSYEHFLNRHFNSPRTSLGQNDQSNLVSKKKMVTIFTIRVLSMLFSLRAVLAVTLPPWLTEYICEYFHFYGNPIPIHIGMGSGSICGNVLCGNAFQYTIFSGKSRVFEFLNKIKNNDVEYKLNERYESKFKIMVRVILFMCGQLTPNIVMAIIYLNIGIVVAYMKSEINLLGAIFVSLVISAFLYDFLCSYVTLHTSIMISSFFLKYQFQQISKDFTDPNLLSHRLLRLIRLHNSLILEVHSFNHDAKYLLYVMVKLIKPSFNTFIYLLFDPYSTWHFRINVIAIVALISLFLLGDTILFATITRFAHRPQFTVYQLLLSRRHTTDQMPLKIRVKAMRFVERLSGPEIGFYCYDLFSMTTYNFTDYIVDSMISFLLILKFFRRIGLI